MGIYPFVFGTARDFEPIVEAMTKVGFPFHQLMKHICASRGKLTYWRVGS